MKILLESKILRIISGIRLEVNGENKEHRAEKIYGVHDFFHDKMVFNNHFGLSAIVLKMPQGVRICLRASPFWTGWASNFRKSEQLEKQVPKMKMKKNGNFTIFLHFSSIFWHLSLRLEKMVSSFIEILSLILALNQLEA